MGTSRSRKRQTSSARPTPPEFIKAWQTSSAVAEVASKLRMKKDQVRVRAFRYRQRGVSLKQFPPVELPVWDWDELAAYAADLVAQCEPPDGVSESPMEADEPAVTA